MLCLGIHSLFAARQWAPSPDIPAVGSQPLMATKPSEAAITSDEMQMAEFNCEYLGVSHFQLMEAVGVNSSREIATRRGTKPNPRLNNISGRGKNGADVFS